MKLKEFDMLTGEVNIYSDCWAQIKYILIRFK
jgi:hypothetical protein